MILWDPASKKVTGQLSARAVFEAIVNSAWQTGEPGIIFLDRLNRDNPCPGQGKLSPPTPCGEQPLLPHEACNLGSINLVNHLRQTAEGYTLDRGKLEKTIRAAVHFLDNVIEVNQYPLPEIDRVTKLTRKIGLGVMGFADMLLYMGIPYNSDAGVSMAKTVMELVQTIGHQESQRLAGTRGAFPYSPKSIYRDGKPLRNATVTTIAPTGTLSIIAGVSSGVEPVFAYAYIRNVMDNTHLIETNQILKDKLAERGLFSDALMREIVEKGTLAHVPGVPEDIRRVFVCAHDVSPIWHVKMQAAFQEYTDNAVSKTVNFPTPPPGKRSPRSTAWPMSWVQGHHHLPGRLPGRAGAEYWQGKRRQACRVRIGAPSRPRGKLLESNCDSTACLLRNGSIMPRPRPDVTMGYTEKSEDRLR